MCEASHKDKSHGFCVILTSLNYDICDILWHLTTFWWHYRALSSPQQTSCTSLWPRNSTPTRATTRRPVDTSRTWGTQPTSRKSDSITRISTGHILQRIYLFTSNCLWPKTCPTSIPLLLILLLPAIIINGQDLMIRDTNNPGPVSILSDF